MSASALAACNIQSNGSYRYMDDLLRLDAQRVAPSEQFEQLSSVICSPLIASVWASNLAYQPDARFASYIANGITDGFRIGYSRAVSSVLASAKRNMRSAYENCSFVEEYIAEELVKGRLVGPIPCDGVSSASQSVHCSPFGVIPKRNRPGKWRLIVDLSSPKHKSVNSGIEPSLCSLKYSGLDEAVALVKSAGRGCLLAKLDLQSAYRVIPVHPDNRSLLAVTWKGDVFLDTALPFGLRSAPNIFSAVADALLFIMMRNGVENSIHI